MRLFASVLLAGLAIGLAPSPSLANGVSSHAHMSDLAVQELPPGELRDLLSDPEVLQALRSGSVFPDSGYAVDDPYGEMAHWEPFTDAYLHWIRENHPPPFDTVDDRRRIAFLLGAMSHGLADQIFDSLFMHKIEQYDGMLGDFDLATDMYLLIEHDPGIAPLMEFVPASEVQEVFATRLSYETSADTFVRGMSTVRAGVNIEPLVARSEYDAQWRRLPWAATHYYGEAEPGSLPHIATFIARYWQVVWERLHGEDELSRSYLGSWPEEGGVNFEVDPARAEARAMLVFGHAIDNRTFSAETVILRAEDGTVVPSHARFQWSDIANAVLVLPDATLAYDTDYTVELTTGIGFMDGRMLPEPVTLSFHTRCAPDRLSDCPALPPDWEPPANPPPRPDAGVRPRPDAGTGMDASAAMMTATSGCACRVGATDRGAPMAMIATALLGAWIARRKRSHP